MTKYYETELGLVDAQLAFGELGRFVLSALSSKGSAQATVRGAAPCVRTGRDLFVAAATAHVADV